MTWLRLIFAGVSSWASKYLYIILGVALIALLSGATYVGYNYKSTMAENEHLTAIVSSQKLEIDRLILISKDNAEVFRLREVQHKEELQHIEIYYLTEQQKNRVYSTNKEAIQEVARSVNGEDYSINLAFIRVADLLRSKYSVQDDSSD